MAGKVAVVTGANTGIGRVTAVELARQGAQVLLACRSAERCAPVIREIASVGGSSEHIPLDLADLASVQRCSERIAGRVPRIDLLVNNAGLAGKRGLSVQGFELAFAVNHLGHFLLTERLRPRLLASASPRVVVVSSNAHYSCRDLALDAVRSKATLRGAFPAYARSKAANVLFCAELARREPAIASMSLHPGVVHTEIWRQIPAPVRWWVTRKMISPEEGAKTSLHCALDPSVTSGGYYDECALREPSELVQNQELARELWERSEQWVRAPAAARSA
ncbi:MAG: SDR family oxidoreductase [Myxococcota bacterium]